MKNGWLKIAGRHRDGACARDQGVAAHRGRLQSVAKSFGRNFNTRTLETIGPVRAKFTS